MPGAAQHSVAAQATCGRPGAQGGHDLPLPTVRTLPQVARGCANRGPGAVESAARSVTCNPDLQHLCQAAGFGQDKFPFLR